LLRSVEQSIGGSRVTDLSQMAGGSLANFSLPVVQCGKQRCE
jgi:hypothetical protein